MTVTATTTCMAYYNESVYDDTGESRPAECGVDCCVTLDCSPETEGTGPDADAPTVAVALDLPCDGCNAEPGEECRPGCLSEVTGHEHRFVDGAICEVCGEPAILDMDRVVEILRTVHGVTSAHVEQTGGGCATIYAGPTRQEDNYGTRYAAIAGPGTFGWGVEPSTGYVSDFYIGSDDDGQTAPLRLPDHADEWLAARLIASQSRLIDPASPIDFGADALRDLHALDDTARDAS